MILDFQSRLERGPVPSRGKRPPRPRLRPLEEHELGDEVKNLVGPRTLSGQPLNIYMTLAHHPELLRRWLVFGSHILGGSTLPPRARELLILRIGYLCRSEYEWGQHARIARLVGITDEEILRITQGPGAPGWAHQDALLLRAADELHEAQGLSDVTWRSLAEGYDERQLLDLVFTVGQYTLVSMALNALGIQREEGVEGFPT